MHDINAIMGKAPARDDTNGATDTDVSAGKTYWGLTNGAWGVRNGTGSAGGLAPSAAQYVFVELAEGNTDVQNGAALLAAYTQAKGLTPGAANRIAVIVPPGRYDLGTGAVTLDTAYIDLVGLTTDREAQYIYWTSNGAGTGVLMQDRRQRGHCQPDHRVHPEQREFKPGCPPARRPIFRTPICLIRPFRNCLFTATEYAWSMRISIEYAGTYEDCTGGKTLFRRRRRHGQRHLHELHRGNSVFRRRRLRQRQRRHGQRHLHELHRGGWLFRQLWHGRRGQILLLQRRRFHSWKRRRNNHRVLHQKRRRLSAAVTMPHRLS